MSVTPTRPEQSLDEETKCILQKRDSTFEKDTQTAVDARKAIAKIRRRINTSQPR